jgi:glycosyltransferase involved in cell wall biosynthesis
VRLRILAAVYNPIAFDGRVQRACEALSSIADVDLFCPDGPPVAGLPFSVQVVRLPAGGPSWRYLRFSSALVRHALRSRPDCLYAHDYFTAGPGALAAALSRATLIYDAHELIIPEPGRTLGRREALWYTMERMALRRACLIIAANAERSGLMQEHYGLAETPLVVRNIPPPPPDSAGTHDLKRGAGERLCVYQGDVSIRRGLDRFLAAVPFLPNHIRLLVVGGGPDLAAVVQLIDRLQIGTRVALLGKVPRAEVHSILRSCDVGLLCYPFEGLNNVYCAPNKIFEYAQAGLPVVATAQPPLAEMLARYRIGLACDRWEQPESIAAKIVDVVTNVTAYRSGLNQLLAENTWNQEQKRLCDAVASLAIGRRRW